MTKNAVPTVTITATKVAPPPTWAIMQRRLLAVMEEAAVLTIQKFTDRGGVAYFADDVDDIYERFYNWGLLYTMGASDEMFRLALQEYNATTRSNSDETQNPLYPWLFPQLHNEYYSLKVPEGQSPSWIPGQRVITDWHHMGEGNQLFYSFGLGDPTISENLRRSRRFAAMMIGEDPEAENYDAALRQFRSVYTDARGPIYEWNVEQVKGILHGGSPTQPGWKPQPMGTRTTLYPIIKELELDWYKKPARAKEVVDTFNCVVLRGDIPHNLASTALVTDAYLYTGDEKYKKWVLEYAGAWLERARKNGGLMPDNIGPTGKIGEQREGQWWGGWYGWNCYKGMDIGLTSMTVAAECAHLLSGDAEYLDIIRTSMQHIMDRAQTRDDGQLVCSWRYGPDGWFDFKRMPFKWLPHLYHSSMSDSDRQMLVRLREGDVGSDWSFGGVAGAKGGGGEGWFHYHDGKYPQWPDDVMASEYAAAVESLERVKAESRDRAQIIAENKGIPNPVRTEGLTMMMLGAPGTVYNGGLLRATVRYFDPGAGVQGTGFGVQPRAGLPKDCAALVDKLGADIVGVQLVNLSRNESRRVTVQAGAFGEHEFTNVTYRMEGQDGPSTMPVNAKRFTIELPPSTTLRVEAGLRRFANQPSYAFPWHVNGVVAPFQE